MDTRCFVAQSVDDASARIAAVCADGFRPTLAVVFASVKHDLGDLASRFTAHDITLFGVSSAGEILADGQDRCVYQEAIVAALIDVDRAAFQVKLFEADGMTSLECGAEVGKWAALAFYDPALLVAASNVHTDGEQILRGIQGVIGPDKPVFGGLAGDESTFTETFVFSNDGASSHAAICLGFDQARVRIDGVASSGWQAVGGEHVITKSVSNIVYTIDDLPAMQVYRECLGIADGGIQLSQYPLQLLKNGYSVLRAALTLDKTSGALVYAGSVPQGSVVRFSAPPGYHVTEDAVAEMQWVHDMVPRADLLILFSCVGRHVALGEMAENEIRPVQQMWDHPLIGFYTYGEIGRNSSGSCEFHNETCVLVALCEVG